MTDKDLDKDLKEINWIISRLEEEQRQKIQTGEIFPENVVPALKSQVSENRQTISVGGSEHRFL